MKKETENLEALKREAIKALIKEEWDEENRNLSEKKETVYLKTEPTSIAMRIFRETEDYETQVMRECEVSFDRYNTYPNAIVMCPETFQRWYGVAQDSALETATDDYLEEMNFEFESFFAEFVQNDSSHKTATGNNVRKRSALIPTPGCRQYDSYPVVVNKEDFN